MSKSKRKKAEGRKVKIKLGKKLPKNVNESKGTFKSAKIVIREQYTQESSTSAKLAEILSRLKNKHKKGKNQAIQNLNNLFENFPDSEEYRLIPHVNQIIEAFFPSMFDEDFIIRKNFRKTLANLIKKIKLAPFFDKIYNYLECSLSHTLNSIKFDTLHVLNTILPKLPPKHKINVRIVHLLSNLLQICASDLQFDSIKLRNVLSVLLRYFHSCGTLVESDLKYSLPDKYSVDTTEPLDVVFSQLAGNLTQILLQKCPDKDCGQIDVKSDFGSFLVEMVALVDVILDCTSTDWAGELCSALETMFPLSLLRGDKNESRGVVQLNLRICRILGCGNSFAVEYLTSMWEGFDLSLMLLRASWLFVGHSKELFSLLACKVFEFDVLADPRLKDLVVTACDLVCQMSDVSPLDEVIPPLLPRLASFDQHVSARLLEMCLNLSRFSQSFSRGVVAAVIRMIGDGTFENVASGELSRAFVNLFIALDVSDLCSLIVHFVEIYHIFAPDLLEFFLTSVSCRLCCRMGEYCSLLMSLLLGVPVCRLSSGCDVRNRAMRCVESRRVVVKCIKCVPVEDFGGFCVSKIYKLRELYPSVMDEETCAVLVEGI